MLHKVFSNPFFCRLFSPLSCLGKWVTEQRSKYKRYEKGESTNLTADQIQTLKEWGFKFEGAIKQPENKAKAASWEERFKQLLEWKGTCTENPIRK